MFIPIVRRTVTVRVREVFHFPFQCDFCKLAVWAHVLAEASGSDTTPYVAPNAEKARQRALFTAHRQAEGTFSMCPCPRCGSASVAQKTAITAWETKAASRKKARSVALLVGFALTFVFSSGCGVLCALQGDDGSVGAGVILGLFSLVLGAAGTGLLYLLLGPGRRPQPLGYIPQNVRFDPPDAAQVQGNYRAG